MPSGPRSTARPGAGPGRGRSRARSAPRERGDDLGPNEPTVALGTSTPGKPGPTTAAADSPERPAAAAPKQASAVRPRGGSAKGSAASAASTVGAASSALQRTVRANLTARALALLVVVLVLVISYATSLRIYFAQAHEIASTKAEIAQSQSTIADLQGQIGRWNDPAYVTSQARERLGWLVPGETGYTVVGTDGKPLGGGQELGSATTTVAGPRQMWWDRMWGSVEAADKPAAAKPNPAKKAPVTDQTKPR